MKPPVNVYLVRLEERLFAQKAILSDLRRGMLIPDHCTRDQMIDLCIANINDLSSQIKSHRDQLNA